MEDMDRIWLGGLLSGCGGFDINPTKNVFLLFRISKTDRELIKEIRRKIGKGTVSTQLRSGNRNLLYTLKLYNKDALKLYLEIRDFYFTDHNKHDIISKMEKLRCKK